MNAHALNKEKSDAVNRLLEGEYVLVHLKTSGQGVCIPEYLRKDAVVTLKLSRWFRGAMAVEDDKIVAELLFNNRYVTCEIPFESVWGLTGDKGQNLIWPEAVPPEVLKTVLVTAPQATKPEVSPPTDDADSAPLPQRRHLRRIK